MLPESVTARLKYLISPDTVYGFTATVLHSRFDNPQPIPEFHKELWALACSTERKVAIAAPRGHAKSTAVTHSFVLAMLLFKIRNFALIVSDTEGQAVLFLGDIKKELQENEELIEVFGVKPKLVKDTETDIIVEFRTGEQFRIIAKGSEQKVRGIKWRNKRPNLIVGDDLENDEIVLNEERRAKFRQWFFNALLPAGSDDCIVRIVGTILHLDALLERLMPPIGHKNTETGELRQWSSKPRGWLSVRYKGHNEDYSHLLWKEKFTKERYKEIQQDYIEQGFPEGYAQEYLNYPIDESTSYFQKQDFLEIEDSEENMDYYVGADLAISEKDSRAYTAIVTAGINSRGKLKVVDVRRFRGDSLEIIDTLFSVQLRWNPELIVIEQENIARSIGPVLDQEMIRRGIFISLEKPNVSQDKIKRARSIQARMRAGQVEFDKEADWYSDLEQEMLQFPKGRYMDQVDALAHIGLILDKMAEAASPQELEDEFWAEEEENTLFSFEDGRDYITGY